MLYKVYFQIKNKTESQKQKKAGEFTNRWKFNNTLFSKATNESRRNRMTYGDKKPTIYQHMCNAVRHLLRAKFFNVNAYIKKEEESQIITLTLHHNK